jgi:hypothetical protein
MGIQGVRNQNSMTMYRAGQSGSSESSGKNAEVKEQLTAQIKTSTSTRLHVAQGQANGAMRHMQEDHYGAMAQLRLRMNFHNQIQQTTNQEVGQVLQTESQEMVSELAGQVQTIIDDFGLGQEASEMMSAFEEQVDSFFNTGSGDQVDAGDVLAKIRDSFLHMFSSLQGMYPVSTVDSAAEEAADAVDETSSEANEVDGEETAVSTVAEQESEIEEIISVSADEQVVDEISNEEPVVSSFEVILQDLHDWFDSEMESIQTTIDELLTPQMNAPRGNGMAYSRFLEIYNELNGLTGQDGGGDASVSETSNIQTEV